MNACRKKPALVLLAQPGADFCVGAFLYRGIRVSRPRGGNGVFRMRRKLGEAGRHVRRRARLAACRTPSFVLELVSDSEDVLARLTVAWPRRRGVPEEHFAPVDVKSPTVSLAWLECYHQNLTRVLASGEVISYSPVGPHYAASLTEPGPGFVVCLAAASAASSDLRASTGVYLHAQEVARNFEFWEGEWLVPPDAVF